MYKKLILLLLISTLSAFTITTYVTEGNLVLAAKKPIPEYAKWGRLAMKETQKRYPIAQIKDYQHVWRETKKDGTTVERFKLWVNDRGKEFGVHVTITFDTKTEDVKNILFVETPN